MNRTMNPSSNHDVIIVGAGPVGLMLACELRLQGVLPVILERLSKPTGLSKALALQGRGVDLLDARGQLERFGVEGKLVIGLPHFAGIPLDVGRLRGRPPKFLFIQQARTEALLEQWAGELGVEVRRGHEVVGLEQDDAGVTVHIRSDAGERSLRARYLVGCDGGKSFVRQRAGIDFPGAPPTLLARLGDVKLSVERDAAGQIVLPDGTRAPFRLGVPLGDGYCRVTTLEPYPEGFDRDAPMTLDELGASVRRSFGIDLEMREPRWLSRFTDASHQAATYRAGRVFVAGDAAHVHLPAGGPGISTGINDAANLGWKLGAEIQGWAPRGLLDTYHAERHPVGARVLLHTRAQGALMTPSVHIAALRELLGEMLQQEQALRFITDVLQGADTRYDMGDAEPHPLVGGWVPDTSIVTAAGARRLPELLRAARGVLVLFSKRDDLHELTAGWSGRVDVVGGTSAPGDEGIDALLVRPDGHVAWAASRPAGAEARAGLSRALVRWFGEPHPARA